MDFDNMLKVYNYVREANILSSNNRSLFYRYLNNKLSNSNMISPLLVTNDNDLSNKYATSNADKSATLSAQFVSKRTMNPIFQISISHLTITTSFSPFHISVVINHKFISSFANKFNISSDDLSKSLAHELNVPLFHFQLYFRFWIC